MIRDDLQMKLDTARNIINTLKLPDYDGSMTTPYSYEGISVTAFEERCRVANSLLLDVRKNLREMVTEEYNERWKNANKGKLF